MIQQDLLFPTAEVIDLLQIDYADIPCVTEPDEELTRRMTETLEAAGKAYLPDWNDCQLIGFFVYEQTGDYEDTPGVTVILDTYPRLAVLGLSKELLHHPSEDYRAIIALHELCHLAGLAHDEDFTARFDTGVTSYFEGKYRLKAQV